MKKYIIKRTNKWLFTISIFLCLITGCLFFQLTSIPFGFLFNMSFFLFIGSVLFTLLLLVIFCFTASKRWLSIVGIFPLILFIILMIVTLIISIDYRILYFQGSPPKPTKSEWIEDLHFLADHMENKYPDLYASVSKELFKNTVKEIEQNILKMSDSEIVMEFFRLLALPNDAHTMPLVPLPCYNLHGLPIRISRFTDGWYIIDAGRSHSHLIGARLVKIGSTAIEEIFKLSTAYISAESSTSRLERFPYIALTPEWLQTQGIIQNIQDVFITLEKPDGEHITQAIPAVETLAYVYWTLLRKIDSRMPSVFGNFRKETYRIELFEDSRTLYIQVNEVDRNISEFSEFVSEYVGTHNFERCVIDLRNNLGGDDRYLKKFVDVIRDSKKINQQNKLFILISRHTISAGVLLAHKLQFQTKAIFIGEPTAQGPVFNANPNFVELPNSKLLFLISTTSTARTQAIWPFNTGAIHPDIFVQYTHNDFLEGKDPVLEAALNYHPVEKKKVTLTEKTMASYTGRYLLNPVHVLDIEQHDASLKFTISDFIHGSLFLLQSDLYPMTEKDFYTDIANVQLHFPSQSGLKAPDLTIDWMGQEKVLRRVSDDFVHGIELIVSDTEKGVQVLLEEKERYISNYPNLEFVLNSLGYSYLNKDEIQKAIHIFRLNTKLFPGSSNTYDSLGEALLKSGEKDSATKNYKKSLELNPNNKNAKKILEQLRKE